MKPENLYDAVGNAPDRLVERADYRLNGKKNGGVRVRVLTILAAAVLCTAALVTAVLLIAGRHDTPVPPPVDSDTADTTEPGTEPPTPHVPPETPLTRPAQPGDFPDPAVLEALPTLTLSAFDAAAVATPSASYEGDAATNQYTKVMTDDVSRLALSPLPTGEWLPVYSLHPSETGEGEAALTAWMETAWAPVLDYFGCPAGSYTVTAEDMLGSRIYTGGDAQSGTLRLHFGGNDSWCSLHVTDAALQPLSSDWQQLTVTPDTPEDVIINMVAGLRDDLNRLCGTHFTQPRFVRSWETGMYMIILYFDDPDIRPAAGLSPRCYMAFEFSVGHVFSAEIPRDGGVHLDNITVRVPVRADSEWICEGKCRALTLAEAEQELYAGHVFGGHSCPLCMAEQEAVTFRGYDAVGLTYLGKDGYYLPFYTFYKYLETGESGLEVYARAYVCAVSLPDYDAYWQSQTAKHPRA